MKQVLTAIVVMAMMLPAADLAAKTWYDDDEDENVPLEYAYPLTLELSLGYAGSPYSVRGESGNAAGVINGVSSFLRVTGMFSKHIGGFFSVGLTGTAANQVSYFGTLNRADGNRYRYDGHGPECLSLPTLLAGPMARIDSGRWSVRPRVGLGVTWLTLDDISYWRIDRGADSRTAPATYFDTYYTNPANEYLEDYYSDNFFIPSFVVSPSLQLTYTLRTHCFLSFEAGYNFYAKKMTQTTYRSESVDAYNPESFVEELYFSPYIGTWRKGDGVVAAETLRTVPGSFYINFGIGWNIGHNRNQKGSSYYHKY